MPRIVVQHDGRLVAEEQRLVEQVQLAVVLLVASITNGRNDLRFR